MLGDVKNAEVIVEEHLQLENIIEGIKECTQKKTGLILFVIEIKLSEVFSSFYVSIKINYI